MPGAPLSLPEREEIAVALIEDRMIPWSVIARGVGRHPVTIAREVTANGGRHQYRPAMAARRAEQALRRPRPCRLAQPGPLRDRVSAELAVGRSPVAIWADLVAEDSERVCVETIYSAVYASVLTVKATECLRSRRPDVDPARPVTPTGARPCPTSPSAQPRSMTEPSWATGKPTRSSGNGTGPRCCG